ncbi:hypothetical protein TELCIR_10352 [Teladorsagia circumcincta]|uniref:Uncharacterized protein n=1 Tax=Teladorsagia circumcincta TaxID=45464 RepID=A0A2G9UCJ1_TELCI|nr:hypothetical protein TELCIR_10352 [Teladorsagia circumcincta]
MAAENRRHADVEEKEKAELAEEVEIAMLNNAFARTARNSFVETVNNDLSRNRDHFLDVIHDDVTLAISGSRRPSIADPPIPLSNTKAKKDDDEVSVSVKIVEKHVIDPSKIEVASVAYMIIFGSSANNFVDGMSAAFSDSLLRGLSIGVAVVSQQFPQELGTLAILINSGLGFRRALLLNLIPIFLSYLGFACGVLLDNVDEDYDEFIFSISSGMYLYIFLGTLVTHLYPTSSRFLHDKCG